MTTSVTQVGDSSHHPLGFRVPSQTGQFLSMDQEAFSLIRLSLEDLPLGVRTFLTRRSIKAVELYTAFVRNVAGEETLTMWRSLFTSPEVLRKIAVLKAVTGLLEHATDDQMRLFEQGTRRTSLATRRIGP